MKRPGITGLTILLAFAVVAVIEFRTVLAMVGLDPATRLYYAASALVVGALLIGLYTLPNDDDNDQTNTSNA